MRVKKIILSLVITLILLLIGAQDSNAATMDYFHNFTGLYLKTENAKIGQKVYVDFYGDATELNSVNIEFVYDNKYFVVTVKDLETQKPYFLIPEGIESGVTYEMISIITECDHGITTYSTTMGNDNFTNCFGRKYLYVKKESNLYLSNLSLASHYTVMKKGYKLWLDVEIKGEGTVGLITMIVRNKENPETCALVSLKQEEKTLQYIDVFNIGSQPKLKDGTYYISDLYINPDREDSIRYTLDESADDAKKLEYYVEFEIDAEEDLDLNIKEDETNSEIDNKTPENEDYIKEDTTEIPEINDNQEETDPEVPEENNDSAVKENDNINIENTEKAPEENKSENNTQVPEQDENTDSIIDENTDKNLKKKIYELLLKIIELLTILEDK